MIKIIFNKLKIINKKYRLMKIKKKNKIIIRKKVLKIYS